MKHEVRGLAYVGIGAADPCAWRDFATGVCGMMPAAVVPPAHRPAAEPPSPARAGLSEEGTLFLKLDERQWRIAVHPLAPGESDGLRYIGFDVAGRPAFDARLEAWLRAGVDVRCGSEALCRARGVEALACLQDPAGHEIELACGPLCDGDFRSPHDMAFRTGALGMGHVVLHVPDIGAALDFYRGVLGFERSDYMHIDDEGRGIHFLRGTRRHHSVALLHLGDFRGLQHLMVETTTLDDVGRALDRALARGIEIRSGLGRHRNDRIVSFYMAGPSGFDVEIGWGGMLVGDGRVDHTFTGSGDEWGHHGLAAAALASGRMGAGEEKG